MAALLPSEVARLVLGYLEDEHCDAAYNEFLNGSPHLDECRGRGFFTRIMGLSLTDMLDDYCAIQSYVFNYKCDDIFKKKMSRSLSLLDKIILIIQNCIQCNNCFNKRSKHSIPPLFESQNLKYYKNARMRRNSCDSISTVHTEISHKCNMHSPRKNPNNMSKQFSNSTDCLTLGTNLADVPGNKNDFNLKEHYHNKNRSKERNDDFNNHNDSYKSEKIASAQNKTDRTSFNKDDFTKSSEQLKKSSPENKIDFRHALGLIKHTDLVDSQKTPFKRKSNKPKSITPKRVIHTTESFPTDTLNVTTITNALLDFPELHEKIADNINQLIRSQKLPNDFEITPSKFKLDTPLKESNNDVIVIDDDTQQMTGVIKAIVEKTEKDPLFDQLLNEVLAASVELMSGSDSDIVSRTETNTPDKSHISISNVGSPTSSCNSYVHPVKPTDDTIKHRLRSSRTQTYCPKVEKPLPKNDNIKNNNIEIKPVPSFPPNPTVQPKKYPRKPRGGKKMDLLRENYEHSDLEEGSNSLIVPSDQMNDSATNTSPPDKKIIILSNERVQTRISNTGSLVICDPDKKNHSSIIGQCNNDILQNESSVNDTTAVFEHSGNISQNVTASQSTPVETPQTPTVMKPEFGKLSGLHTGNALSVTIKSGVVKVDEISANDKLNRANNISGFPNSPLIICPFSTDPSKIKIMDAMQCGSVNGPPHTPNSNNIEQNIGTTSKLVSNFHKHKVMSGKPPDIVITKNRLVNSPNKESLYSEVEIMKMPTIIMLKPTDETIDLTGLNTERGANVSDLSTILLSQNENKICDFYNINNVNTTTKFQKIYPKIEKPNDIVSLCNYNPNQPKLELAILDTKGLDVYPSGSSTALVETNATVPYTLSIINDINVCTNDPKSNANNLLCNKINIIDHPNKIVDIIQDNVVNVNPESIAVVSNNNADGGDSKLQTPHSGTAKKVSMSTPSRRYRHVRTLDFDSPSNAVNRKKALTSPKKGTEVSDRNVTPVSIKHTKAHNVKSCLFSIPEEDVSKNMVENDIKNRVEASSVTNNNVEINKLDEKFENKLKVKSRFNVKYKDSDKKENEGKIIKRKHVSKVFTPPKKSWDQDLRVLVPQKPALEWQENVNVKRRKKRRPTDSRSDKKLKSETSKEIAVEAKMLEAALLEKSASESQTENKSLEEIKCDNTDSVKVAPVTNFLMNNSLVANDLELSTNTTTDEILNCSQNSIKNTINDDVKKSSAKKIEPKKQPESRKRKLSPVSLKKTKKHDSTPQAIDKKELYLGSEKYSKINIDISKENAVPLGKNKNKPRSGTFKVKLGSKTFVNTINKRNVSDDSIHTNSESSKSNKHDSKIHNKSNDNLKIIEVEAKKPKIEPESNIPESSHITPEMPREFRSNPINVRCNLGPLMETPFKSSMMDISMTTPRFLTPGLSSDPISTIKSLGYPTPNFNVTPMTCSNPKESGKEGTPESSCSKPTGYSSCSSYYKPDEVEDFDILNKSMKKKKSPPITVKHKKEDTSSSNTRVLRPRRKPLLQNLTSPIKPMKSAKKVLKTNRNHDFVFKDLIDSTSSEDSSTDSANEFSNSESDDNCSPKFKNKICSTSTPFNDVSKKENYLSKVKQMKEQLSNKLSSSDLQQKQSLEEKRLRVMAKLYKSNERTGSNKVLRSKNGIKKHPSLPKSNLLLEKNHRNISPKKNKPTLSVSFSMADLPESKQGSSKENLATNDEAIPISKSNRRKSSTPRKLEQIQFKSENLLQSKIQFSNDNARNVEYTKKSETKVKFADDVEKLKQKSDDIVVNKTDELINVLSGSNDCRSQVDTEANLSEKKSAFLKNLEKEGFDPVSAKLWEKGLKEFPNCEESLEYANKKNSPHVNDAIISNVKSSVETPENLEIENELIKIHSDTPCEESANVNGQEPLILGDAGNVAVETDVETYVWNDMDCNQSSSNYIMIQYDNTIKKKKKKNPLLVNCSVDDFNLNLMIYNSVLERDENCLIKATSYVSVIDSPPDANLKKRKKYFNNKKAFLKKKKSKSPDEKKPRVLQILIDELSKSSTESLLPIQTETSNCDNLTVNCFSETEQDETNAAVKNLLKDLEPSNKSPASTINFEVINDNIDGVSTNDANSNQSESVQLDLEKAGETPRKVDDDDLMSFVVTGCKTAEETETRKTINEITGFPTTNIDMSSLDIHSILDQLHPEDTKKPSTKPLNILE